MRGSGSELAAEGAVCRLLRVRHGFEILSFGALTLAYTFSGPTFATAVVEPGSGGRWFERDESGRELPWGEVRAYEEGRRLVLSFAIGLDRQPTPAEEASEVEVRFTPADGERTKVAVEHRDFARHGEGAAKMREAMDSPQGWPLILAELRRAARRVAPR